MSTPAPPCPAPRAGVVIVLPAAVDRTDAPGLCAGVRGFVEAGHPVVIDLGGVRRACLGLVDVLARLQLMARRLGGELTITGADADVQRLLELTGLSDRVPSGD